MNTLTRRFYQFGPFRIDAEKRVLMREGEIEPLAPKAFDMLLVLVQRHGEVLEKTELMEILWPDRAVEEANLPQNISALRKALGESPNDRRYIITIPGRGYRFAAEVQELDGEGQNLILGRYATSTIVNQEHESSPGDANRAPSARPGINPRLPGIKTAYVVATAVIGSVLLAVAIFYWTRGATDELGVGAVQTSVAVLPFRPLIGEERDEALEIGMAEALINKLSTVRQLVVRPLGVVRRYTALEQDPLAAGREMDVDAVIESTLQKSGDKVRVTARLLRVRDGVALWSYTSDEAHSNLLSLQDLLAEKVAASLVAKLSDEQRKVIGRQNYTDNAEAYQLYLKGRFFFEKVTPDGVRKSIGYFQEAIDNDPDFALAYCGMCASYTLFGHLRVLRPEEAFPAAKAALARALELDGSLSEAHSQMGFISLHYDYDWARADREFERAVDLNPNSPMAHHGRAFYLAAVGRTDDALVEIRRALDLDPVSLHLNADAGVLFYYARRADDAIAQLRKTLEMEPDFALAVRYLAKVYAHKRMDKQAFVEYERSAGLFRGAKVDDARAARAAKAFAASGLAGYYRLELYRLKTQLKERYGSAFELARLYALLGERDSALEWLGKSIEERNFEIPLLKVHPDFDNVRSDIRFSDLTRKIGLQ